MRGTTKSNFEFEIDDELLDNWDVLEGLCALDRGEVTLFPVVVKQVLGESQLDRLKNHVRDDKGKVSAKILMEEFTEMLNYNQTVKNS